MNACLLLFYCLVFTFKSSMTSTGVGLGQRLAQQPANQAVPGSNPTRGNRPKI